MSNNLAEKQNEKMEYHIRPAPTAIETFRDSGYRSTAAALAELIDNSIEANASTIQVMTFESPHTVSRRTVQRIDKIAVYDDGAGMSPEVLAIALQFGNGTRLKTRKGMGRFGIGLPNASVSQCCRVEIYSWQNSKCYTTHLDVNEIKEQNLQFANVVSACEMPTELLASIEGKVGKSGTLIVWSKCDRLDVARTTTLYRDMEKDLCRLYRHFLDNDSSYGRKVNIQLISTGKDRKVDTLHANDPLYLLTPNNVPGKENEATNVAYGKPIPIEVEYAPGKTSTVEMRFSIALPETQALGGNSVVGRHYQHNTGISFVRAGREIDFGTFGFFNPREERQRWWGCEIRFEPELDELFGVTNNKQSVRSISYVDMKELEDTYEDSLEEVLQDDKRLWLKVELSKHFANNNKSLMKDIEARGVGARSNSSKQEIMGDKSTKVANEQLQDVKTPTKASVEAKKKTEEQKLDEWKDRLEKADPKLTDDEIAEIAQHKAKLKIDKDFSTWPGEQFFTVETRGETTVISINKRHTFFTELYEPLLDHGDSKFVQALDLLMMAYAEAEAELYSHADELEQIRSKWGHYVQKFLKALKEEA